LPILLGLAWNWDPPNLHLPSCWDYRYEVWHPTSYVFSIETNSIIWSLQNNYISTKNAIKYCG
jgi:hypothetical protein